MTVRSPHLHMTVLDYSPSYDSYDRYIWTTTLESQDWQCPLWQHTRLTMPALRILTTNNAHPDNTGDWQCPPTYPENTHDSYGRPTSVVVFLSRLGWWTISSHVRAKGGWETHQWSCSYQSFLGKISYQKKVFRHLRGLYNLALFVIVAAICIKCKLRTHICLC